ncbi:MAG: GNAT family N-acetyltransferase [bacterium]|nr:GNAT family N-acetyltransferase [bacterium]
MDDAHVRQARKEDLESILLLSDELTFSDLPYDREVDVAWAHTNNGKDYYSEKINERKGICFVAEQNNKIVGYATAAEKEIPSYRKVKVVELENLVVKKEKRGKRIGKMLLDAFMKWAKATGAHRVSVNVFALNEKGISFYRREGFLPFESILEMHVK